MIIYLASPYSGDVERNIAYAQECMRYSLARGEVPVASHLLYTQVLDDSNDVERDAGMRAGRDLIAACERLVAYVDLGLSDGMKREIEHAKAIGVKVELRKIRFAEPLVLPNGWAKCEPPHYGYLHESGRASVGIDAGFRPWLRGSESVDEAISDAQDLVAMLSWLKAETGTAVPR